MSGQDEGAAAQDGNSAGTSTGRLVIDVMLYSLMRIALVVAIAAAIYGIGRAIGVEIPIIIAALFALIIALPLGFALFRGQRAKVNEGIGQVDEQRRSRRDDLRSRLRGTGANYYERADDSAGDDSGETSSGESTSGGN